MTNEATPPAEAFEFRPARREDVPTGPFFVSWIDIVQEDVDAFREALDTASGERDIQRYLETNPMVLVQHLGGGHGRWVIPQKKLGAEHVPDFVIGQRDSMGLSW